VNYLEMLAFCRIGRERREGTESQNVRPDSGNADTAKALFIAQEKMARKNR
jgi:hypothetical protein